MASSRIKKLVLVGVVCGIVGVPFGASVAQAGLRYETIERRESITHQSNTEKLRNALRENMEVYQSVEESSPKGSLPQDEMYADNLDNIENKSVEFGENTEIETIELNNGVMLEYFATGTGDGKLLAGKMLDDSNIVIAEPQDFSLLMTESNDLALEQVPMESVGNENPADKYYGNVYAQLKQFSSDEIILSVSGRTIDTFQSRKLVQVNHDGQLVNILMKLDSNNMVYDIDIV